MMQCEKWSVLIMVNCVACALYGDSSMLPSGHDVAQRTLVCPPCQPCPPCDDQPLVINIQPKRNTAEISLDKNAQDRLQVDHHRDIKTVIQQHARKLGSWSDPYIWSIAAANCVGQYIATRYLEKRLLRTTLMAIAVPSWYVIARSCNVYHGIPPLLAGVLGEYFGFQAALGD